MRKFILHILLFLLPVALLMGWFLRQEIPRRDQYAYLRGDCSNQGIWIYDRIYRNPEKIDVAFLGTSRMMNSVSDRILSLDSLSGKTYANLGYCRPGRNLQYLILHDLLSAKKPSAIVLEIRERESRVSHPIFPNLATPAQLFESFSWNHPAFFEDVYPAFLTRYDLLKSRFWGDTIPYHYNPGLYGHSCSEDTIAPDQIGIPNPPDQSIPPLAKKYLEKIATECKSAGVKLYFLYLPGAHKESSRPSLMDTYNRLGTLLIPPDSIIANPDLFYDADHFNRAGSNTISEWLKGVIP